MIKLTFKKLQDLHKKLGGNEAGYYITTFGNCTTTKEAIKASERLAYNQVKGANWTYQLVKGEKRFK